MKNGIIGFMLADKKVIDIKITNAFPIIALGSLAKLVSLNGEEMLLKEYQHFSIPSDLNIHFTKGDKQDYIFFVRSQIEDQLNTTNLVRLFTLIGDTKDNCSKLSGSWFQAVLIGPFEDHLCTGSTRMVIEFFLHKDPQVETYQLPDPVKSEIRIASDRSGCLLGPFRFSGIQRRTKEAIDLYSTIRMGFCEIEDKVNTIIYIPFEIKDRV